MAPEHAMPWSRLLQPHGSRRVKPTGAVDPRPHFVNLPDRLEHSTRHPRATPRLGDPK